MIRWIIYNLSSYNTKYIINVNIYTYSIPIIDELTIIIRYCLTNNMINNKTKL